MNERVGHQKLESMGKTSYDLRAASVSDLEFLFRVSTGAMQPVDMALNPSKAFDREEEFKKYKEKFIPDEIQIITLEGRDVGRLRVVRGGDSIYVGGIQILPEFQGKGIGTALFQDLIEESEKTGRSITLEVHDVNIKAIDFYKSLGFISVGSELNKTHMEFTPNHKVG